MTKIFPDEITEGTNSLDLKQEVVFNVVHTWAEDYAKHYRHDVEPAHIFFSDSGGIGRSNFINVIYNTTTKT